MCGPFEVVQGSVWAYNGGCERVGWRSFLGDPGVWRETRVLPLSESWWDASVGRLVQVKVNRRGFEFFYLLFRFTVIELPEIVGR